LRGPRASNSPSEFALISSAYEGSSSVLLKSSGSFSVTISSSPMMYPFKAVHSWLAKLVTPVALLKSTWMKGASA